MKSLILLLLLVFLVPCRPDSTVASEAYDHAVKLLDAGQSCAEVIPFLEKAVAAGGPEQTMEEMESRQLLGSCYMRLNRVMEAKNQLEISLKISENRPSVFGNYIEVLRAAKLYNEALDASARAYHLYPEDLQIAFNSGVLRQEMNLHEEAISFYLAANEISPAFEEAWQRAVDCMTTLQQRQQEFYSGNIETISMYLQKAIHIFPASYMYPYLMGVLLHKGGRLAEALVWYRRSEAIQGDYVPCLANIGAVYQGLGEAEKALEVYSKLIPLLPGDAGIRNNYGSLLGTMGKREEELYWLLEAYRLDPTLSNVNINLAGYYQDDGELVESARYLLQAIPHVEYPSALRLRIATALSPVVTSWEKMVQERATFEISILSLLQEVDPRQFSLVACSSDLDYIHFYIVYHGLNDRYIQELMASVYRLYIRDLEYISPHLSIASADRGKSGSIVAAKKEREKEGRRARRTRIGFLSKFFGIFEPHGLLLDGVMAALHRDRFHVVGLPVLRTDGKPLAPTIAAACDEVYDVPLAHHDARHLVSSLQLDILVFADTLSEPITHFLAYSRLAYLQVGFWGNPVTSGSPCIDYFISATGMEHPYRTRFSEFQGGSDRGNVIGDAYTEQVVLLGGQGIWYRRPKAAHRELLDSNWKGYAHNQELQQAMSGVYNRSSFGLEQQWFVYLCPQSTFKMHPLFDRVMADVLMAAPQAHLVLTGGRRDSWTKIYTQRVHAALDDALEDSIRTDTGGGGASERDESKERRNLHARLHVIPRVSSEKFQSLLSIADVLLHPFPFDGSKTSADALHAGIPFVTLPSEQLRGRMGMQFLRTMNLPELVARNSSHYVHIAASLCQDPIFFARIKRRVVQGAELIWEDSHVLFEWTRFFDQLHYSQVEGDENEEARCELSDDEGWEAFLSERAADKHGNGSNISHLALDVDIEQHLHEIRQRNRQEFDDAFGSEEYLLDDRGRAVLESHVDYRVKVGQVDTAADLLPATGVPVPRIFRDWATDLNMGYAEQRNRSLHATWRQRQPPPELLLPQSTQWHEQEHNGVHPVVDRHSTDASKMAGLDIKILSVTSELVKDSRTAKLALSSPAALTIQAVPPPELSEGERIERERIRNGIISGGAQVHPPPSAQTLEEVATRKKRVWTTARNGHLEAATTEALSLLSAYPSVVREDAMFLTEIGCIYYFQGEYAKALQFCHQGRLLNGDLTIAYICMGVSGIYLDKEEETLSSLSTAVRLMQEEAAGLRAPSLSAVFSATRESIEFNLVTAYRRFQRYDECVASLGGIFEVPELSSSPPTERGVLSLVMAFVNWSPRNRAALAGEDFDLLAIVEQLQAQHAHLLNLAVDCLSLSAALSTESYYRPASPHSSPALQQAYASLHSFVRGDGMKSLGHDIGESPPHVLSRTPPGGKLDHTDVESEEGLVLVTQVYSPANTEARMAVAAALVENIANPAFTDIVLFTDSTDDSDEVNADTATTATHSNVAAQEVLYSLLTSYLEDSDRVQRDQKLWYSLGVSPHDDVAKVRQRVFAAVHDDSRVTVIALPLNQRLTFGTAFRYAAEKLDGRIVVLCNSDIAFDGTLSSLLPSDTLDLGSHVLALSKWIEEGDSASDDEQLRSEYREGRISLVLRTDSQDAWIFRAPLPEVVMEESRNVPLGVTRCDNVLAHMMWSAGKLPVNPAFAVRAIERRGGGKFDGELYDISGAAFGKTRDVLLSDWWSEREWPRLTE